ncbi:MAG TPA: squalene--hopene cyclase [Planctomycetes bacterium]|nr:squalene--hopene cyclase [Planctomycetota bacterium]HIJ70005.1 squalene--hopene cyclase [Planctomycetota bacterium]
MHIETESIEQTLSAAKKSLIAARLPEGYWPGYLSGSALATATAVFALFIADEKKHKFLIHSGLDWLGKNQNPDGGWGDSILSRSNLPATMLCWAAFTAQKDSLDRRDVVARAESWIVRQTNSLKPHFLISAINQQYGNDRTFSVPILTMCALAGRLGVGTGAWSNIKPLPFELAACPHQLFKWLRLPVVSYALPALIAIGQVNYHKNRPANPLLRLLRHATRAKTLAVLENIQPAGGGFLEAVPLTAFVVMSLAAAGRDDSPVVSKGIEFLRNSVRDDGSWPIDTNLATWLTTLSVNALAAGSDFENILPLPERKMIQDQLLLQQYTRVHPYTHTPPGGWAWTHLSGGVPDADDTAAALIALANLNLIDERVIKAAAAGVKWLLGQQNRDGGFPTFCRGRLKLPFDRSSPDLTSHAVSAMALWQDKLTKALSRRISTSIVKGIKYLVNVQADDGSWVPLWFGNESAPHHANPVYGTSRVLTALQKTPQSYLNCCALPIAKAVGWLLSVQNHDGGWGPAKAVKSSIEESAVALDALAGVSVFSFPDNYESLKGTIERVLLRGAASLADKTDKGNNMHPAPIGLYFARLWYFEKLYPFIFTVSALNKVKKLS